MATNGTDKTTGSGPVGFGDDTLLVDTSIGDLEGGARPEAEEKQIDVHTPMIVQNAQGLAIRGQIVVQTTVEQATRKIKYACKGCAHWNNQFWQEYLAIAKTRPENHAALNALRNQCLSSTDQEFVDKHQTITGEFDAEHALGAFGMCQAITNEKREAGRVFDAALTVTLPDEASCLGIPQYSDGNGDPRYFLPRTKESWKARQAYADQIKTAASGKVRS